MKEELEKDQVEQDDQILESVDESAEEQEELEDSKASSRQEHFPTKEAIQAELNHTRYRTRFRTVLRNAIFAILIVVAISVITAVVIMPVMQIVGSSMNNTLEDGDITLALNSPTYHRGEVIAFYYNNTVLVKRIIGVGGDEIEISEDGQVSVNGQVLEEPYVANMTKGDCNIVMPYTVPEAQFFVMGDNRSLSVDSRNTALGCINEESIIGRLVITVWPLKHFSFIGRK